MLQDVERGRLTEIEVINGAIVDGGQRLGIATPTTIRGVPDQGP